LQMRLFSQKNRLLQKEYPRTFKTYFYQSILMMTVLLFIKNNTYHILVFGTYRSLYDISFY
jgi:hypothetical protein